MGYQTIFKKCPFKENGKLSKLFRLVPRGLNLPAGSDTPQNKILRGIRPRRTRSCGVSDPTELAKSCGVSDPAEQWQSWIHFIADTCSAAPEKHPSGSDTPLNKVLRVIRPRRALFFGVSDPTEQVSSIKCIQLCHCSAGSNTPQDTKSWGGIKPQGTIFKYEYFREFETEFKNILGCEFGDYMGSIRGKNRR